MSERFRLDVWLDGFDQPAGTLVAHEDESIGFAYRDDYRDRPEALPLSLCLPLGEEFTDPVARAFFGNLLPENNQMQRVIEREGIDRGDIAGILFHVGADCSGAISCLPEGSPPAKIPGRLGSDYRVLRPDEINAIVHSLAERRRLPDEFDDPSPVAGVQGKIALTLDAAGEFALPAEGLRVPTTHILKVPRHEDARDVAAEAAACRLAAACGLETSIPTVLDIDGVAALLIPRFDRVVIDATVSRIHQEDFAQALALPPSLKYERRGTEGRRFDATAIAALLDRTAEPARARAAFLLATFFNLAVGNTDNHAKNHALLYDRGRTPRLAPLYDILPILLSDRYTHDLAFRIGDAKCAADLKAGDLIGFLNLFRISGAAQGRFISEALCRLLADLDIASYPLTAAGLKSFDDLIGREAGRLAELLKLNIDLRERDHFEARAGGWLMS